MSIAPATTETSYQLIGTNVGPFSTVWPYDPADAPVVATLNTGVAVTTLAEGTDYTVLAPTPLTTGATVTLSIALLNSGDWPAGAVLTLSRRISRRRSASLSPTIHRSPRARSTTSIARCRS